MSHTKDRVMELMETDDSYDGEGWLGEIILIQHQGSAMSHTARSQESQRKHGKTPDGNNDVLLILEQLRLRSVQVSPDKTIIEVMPKFVTVKDMNYTGEVLHGKWDGTYYVLDDGDCYTAERLADEYGAIFSDTDPAKEPS